MGIMDIVVFGAVFGMPFTWFGISLAGIVSSQWLQSDCVRFLWALSACIVNFLMM